MFAIVAGPLPVVLPEYFQALRHWGGPVGTAIVVVLALIVVEGAVGISHAKAAARQALSYD
jgi:hypothetical protein